MLILSGVEFSLNFIVAIANLSAPQASACSSDLCGLFARVFLSISALHLASCLCFVLSPSFELFPRKNLSFEASVAVFHSYFYLTHFRVVMGVGVRKSKFSGLLIVSVLVRHCQPASYGP